jgi:hypothetical protein
MEDRGCRTEQGPGCQAGSSAICFGNQLERNEMFQRPIPQPRIPQPPEIAEARFKRFLKDFEVYERKLSFEQTLDAFLDLYSAWRKTREPDLKLRLVMLAFELHRLNSEFQCDLSFTDAPSASSCGTTTGPASVELNRSDS